jgi:manganese oxidase
VDLHTAHFHANTFTYDDHELDVMELLPATFRKVDMVTDAVGTWLMHCKYYY